MMIKKKSRGFTLAEVLITLGIIGIVSALTMPQLFNRTRNAHLGAQLATAISTVENGVGVYLYDNNVKSIALLENGELKISTLLDKLHDEKYIKFSEYSELSPDGCDAKFVLPDKSVIGECGTGDIVAFDASTVSGSNMFLMSSTSTKNVNLIEGLDYFRMYLAADGHIYLPGLDYNVDAPCDEENGGEGCVGKIAKNGWKVNY